VADPGQLAETPLKTMGAFVLSASLPCERLESDTQVSDVDWSLQFAQGFSVG